MWPDTNLVTRLVTNVAVPCLIVETFTTVDFNKDALMQIGLAAFISTHDTYLHSWGSILVQDVIMPFRKEPFDKDTHLKVLRYSIYGVAVFIFFFSLLFQQNQKIALFLQLPGQYSLVEQVQ